MVQISKIEGDVAQTLRMPTRLWRCEKNDANTLKMPEYATKNLTLHEHALRREIMQHQLQIHDLLSFWRGVTLSKFERHDVERHHFEGRWCGSNFQIVKWHNLEERQCSLNLKGTRRCSQEIGDAKHTSKMWEDVHRRWAMPCKLHSLQKKLKIVFYSTNKNQLMFIIILRKAE